MYRLRNNSCFWNNAKIGILFKKYTIHIMSQLHKLSEKYYGISQGELQKS